MNITIANYLQTFVRPLIGDTKQYDDNNNLIENMLKYSDNYLLTLYNEALRDVSKNTDFFNKKTYFLLEKGQSFLNLPDDFSGYHSTDTSDISMSGTSDTRYRGEILQGVIETNRISLKTPLTEQDIALWNKDLDVGAVISQDIINELVQSGQLTLQGSGVLYAYQMKDKIILSLNYKYKPSWKTAVSENAETDEDLLLTIKYYIGAKALESDQPNEATNKGAYHYKFYISMREELDRVLHRWSDVSLSTYRGDI